MAGERRWGANDRPWLGLDRRTLRVEDASGDEAPHQLPPEQPFAGDHFDTIDALWAFAAIRARRRRAVRWVGAVVVGALIMHVAGPLLLRAWWW